MPVHEPLVLMRRASSGLRPPRLEQFARGLRRHVTCGREFQCLITGDADMFAPPFVLRLFAARIKNAESVIVPEAGHSGYWERPEIFNRAVLEFLRKH